MRTRTDQTFPKMMSLIEESRKEFESKYIANKLLHRFWNVLQAYKDGQSYINVLENYFSSKSKENVSSHRKISNNKL